MVYYEEDKVYDLATQLFLKKGLPTYMHDNNEKLYKDIAKDCIMVAKLFNDEYNKIFRACKQDPNIAFPPDEL